MGEWPSMDYIKGVCKIGQGAACCRYLTIGADWRCEKGGSLSAVLDARVQAGMMAARGEKRDRAGADPSEWPEDLRDARAFPRGLA